jgi:hypothetical protein
MFGLVWSGLRPVFIFPLPPCPFLICIQGKLSHRLPKKFHAKTNKRNFERQIAASERRWQPTGSTFDGASHLVTVSLVVCSLPKKIRFLIPLEKMLAFIVATIPLEGFPLNKKLSELDNFSWTNLATPTPSHRFLV